MVHTVRAQGPIAQDEGSRPRGLNAKKTALVTAAALLSVNILTGAPLLALWVAAQVTHSWSGGAGISMTAVLVVILVLALTVAALMLALMRVHAAYDELTGRPHEERRTSPWLRSMRGEREDLIGRRVRSSPVEVVVMLSVVAAVLALEVWMNFFAHEAISGLNR